MGKKRKNKGKKVEYILVRSLAYGDHYRVKRGTYTEVSLADGMKASGTKQSTANLMAKIIFDAVNDLAPGFKNTVFWSRLLKIFRAQQKAGGAITYLPFQKMEMRPTYRSHTHGDFYIGKQANSITTLNYTLFREPTDRAYAMSVLRIATDETLLNAYPPETITTTITGELEKGELLLDFIALPATAQCLYVLKCEKLRHGKIMGTLASKSVVFLRQIG